MNSPPAPPQPPPQGPPHGPRDGDALQDDALERALFDQGLLPAPPDLAARVVAGLPRPAGRVLSLQAVARLAAAVLLAVGTWVAAFGGVPTLAHAQPPQLVEEVLAPTREILRDAPVDLGALGLEDAAAQGGNVPPAALAGVGAALLGAGLLLARRAAKEKTA